MKDTILKFLKGADYISGEDLSKRLGISRTAVWKHVQSLKEQGYDIKSMPRKGYKLEGIPDLLDPVLIFEKLNTRFMGNKIYHHEAITSTNNKAKEIAEAGAPEGTVVLAEKQLQGRGRLGRTWESPAGGIWMSVILRPNIPPAKAHNITLVAACAVAKTLRQYNIPARIKWPNDILLNGKKVCGILTELKAEMDGVHYLVLGIGMNVNTEKEMYPPELKDKVSSLKIYTGQNLDRVELLCSFLKNLEEQYEIFLNEGVGKILETWKQHNITLNNHVQVRSGNEVYSGLAVNIDKNGGLIVKDENGNSKTFYSGEVTLQG